MQRWFFVVLMEEWRIFLCKGEGIMRNEKQIVIDDQGNTIPIVVELVEGEHIISVDGVEWLRTANMTHAAVLFNMMAEHLTEYMTYAVR